MSLACVLVVNCDSLSMEFSVIPQDVNQSLLLGLARRLGINHTVITFKGRDGHRFTVVLDDASHQHAFKVLFARLDEQQLLEAINTVGYRVAHGGSDFKRSVLVTDDVIEKVRTLSVLAPSRNPVNPIGIEAVRILLPALPYTTMFDTVFHQTLSLAAYTYAIPPEFQQDYMMRRCGFHGTSHRRTVVETFASLDLDPANHGIVVAHLDNGSSLCTVQDDTSIDTSMDIAPLEGLVMGTRCGGLDFDVVAYLTKCTGQTFDTLYKIPDDQSDLMGISSLSSDCRIPRWAHDEGHERAALAIDMSVHRLARRINGHVTSLKRFDVLIFIGGIGENLALIQEFTVQRLQALGLELGKRRNQQLFSGRNGLISKTDTTKITVIPTNEEKMVAIDTTKITRAA